jgi:gamma-glutamyltranspeptidase
LLRGGNAVDAAVAATLCLGVVSPGSSGIGGGCFILTHNGTTRENVFIDSREVAPAAARPDMFAGAPLKAQDGGLAVAVFSELKGLHLAWRQHGRLPWSDLVRPAAQLAQRWTVSKETAALLQQVVGQLRSGLYPGLSALYVKADGAIKTVGDVVEQPLLADTLAKVGRFGPDYLYVTMAPTLAAEIQAAGGVVTAADMQAYVPDVLKPLTASFMGHTYVGASGSSSGGIAVAAVLEFLGGYPEPLASQGDVFYHRLVEAFNHVFAMRLSLADPSFVNTTGVTAAMLSAAYMGRLRAATSDRAVLPRWDRYGGRYNLTYAARQTAGGALPTDHGTTHISVLDRWGNAVALTSTINTYFGSKVVSPSTGILFNNQMDDFSVPGASNFFGLAPSALNYPQPGKKPLSSMSPSFVLLPPLATDTASGKGAKLRLVGGGSGGPKIITVTTQMIVNVIGRGLDLLTAVMVPRLHAQVRGLSNPHLGPYLIPLFNIGRHGPAPARAAPPAAGVRGRPHARVLRRAGHPGARGGAHRAACPRPQRHVRKGHRDHAVHQRRPGDGRCLRRVRPTEGRTPRRHGRVAGQHGHRLLPAVLHIFLNCVYASSRTAYMVASVEQE